MPFPSQWCIQIAKEIGDCPHIPGMKLDAIPFQGHIALIPLESIESMRGFLKGIDTTVPREDDRE